MSATSVIPLGSGGTIGVFRRRVIVSAIEEKTDFDISWKIATVCKYVQNYRGPVRSKDQVFYEVGKASCRDIDDITNSEVNNRSSAYRQDTILTGIEYCSYGNSLQ